MKTTTLLTAIAIAAIASATSVRAHCQVPCGIYDDQMRIDMMKEHVATIEKAMTKLAAGENANQTTRWVLNKEKHAEELTDIVTYYFMAQRIKPGMDGYEAKLTTLHQIMVSAMKAKQTTDLAHTAKLTELIDKFAGLYFGKQDAHAGHKH